MSQPPSLPKLTSFLRPGQPQAPPPPRGDVTSIREDRSMRSVEKRHLDQTIAHDSPHPHPTYPQNEREYQELHRQKRRANMFAQYGDAQYSPSQHQQPLHRGYDRRHPSPQQPFPSPSTQSLSPYGSRVPPPPMRPPLVDHRRPVPPQGVYRGNYNLNPGRAEPSPRDHASPLGTPDAQRVNTVKTEPPLLSAPQEPIQRERKSRYLSESDRRSIIARIDQGEKQVSLAKEYQVSRAAICNLYKNRKEVLTRAEREPKPRQTKRAKVGGEEKAAAEEARSATAIESGTEEKEHSEEQPGDDDVMSDENSSTESIDTDPATGPGSRSPSVTAVRRPTASPPQALRVYNASASSYPIRRLMSMLRNPRLPQATLRNVTKRLVNGLIEELLVCLPRREVNILTPSGDPFASIQPIDDAQVCAISLDNEGSIMLPSLVEIFPSVATSLVTTTRHADSAGDQWSVSCRRLPYIHNNASVLLLAIDCVTGARIAAVIEYLVNVCQVQATSIYVATVISSQPGIARVQKHFPGVTVISAAIDEALDEQNRIQPGIGDLMERFWYASPPP